MSKGGSQPSVSTTSTQVDPQVKASYLGNVDYARQTANNLGAQQFGLLPDIAPVKLQQYQKIAPPPPPPSGLMNYMGGNDGNGGEGMGDPRLSLRYNDTMNTGTFVDQFGRTVSNTGSIGDTGMGVNSQGKTVSNLGTIAAQNDAMFGRDAYFNSESP